MTITKEYVQNRISSLRQQLEQAEGSMNNLSQQFKKLSEARVQMQGAISVLQEILAKLDEPQDSDITNDDNPRGDIATSVPAKGKK